MGAEYDHFIDQSEADDHNFEEVLRVHQVLTTITKPPYMKDPGFWSRPN